MLNFRDLASLTVDALKEVKGSEEDVNEEEETESDKRSAKIKEHFDYMIDNSSFHGINYIVDERYPLRRIIWFVITVSAFIYSVSKVYETTTEFLAYPFQTAIMRKYVDELVFPAVSICNMNDFQLSVVNDSILDRMIRNQPVTRDPTADDIAFMQNSTHRLEEMFVECIFNGEECTPNNFTEFNWIQGDRCFTFNSGKKNHRLLSVTGAGIQKSLMLTLNIQHYDYYRDRHNAGIHLMIHGQDESPVRIQGPIISPGFSTYVQVDKKRLINLEPPYETRCGTRKLKYHREYSIDACWLDQLTEYVLRKCNCKEVFMPGISRNCNLTELGGCLWPSWEDFKQNKLADCPLPCLIDTFHWDTKRISRALFPSESYANTLKVNLEKLPHMRGHLSKLKDKEKVKEFMRDNLLRIIIYFDDLSYELQEQKPRYSLAFFLGDIGGQIGLFVGAGAMSYFEIIDCLGMIFHTKYFESFQ